MCYHTSLARSADYLERTFQPKSERGDLFEPGKNKVEAQERDKWIPHPDVTPAIVDKATFDAAQEALERKYPPTKNTNSDYFLTGFIFCPECGSPLCGATLQGKYRYYYCRGTRPTRTRGRNEAGRHGKLHAKCAIVDNTGIVGSANLTDDAFNRNMELGVILREEGLVEELVSHFEELRQKGVLKSVDLKKM